MISKVREVTIEIEISMVTDTHLRVSRTNLLFITKILFLVEGYTLLSVLSVNCSCCSLFSDSCSFVMVSLF